MAYCYDDEVEAAKVSDAMVRLPNSFTRRAARLTTFVSFRSANSSWTAPSIFPQTPRKLPVRAQPF